MKFVIITFLVIFLVSETICINNHSEIVHDTIISNRKENNKNESNNLDQVSAKNNANTDKKIDTSITIEEKIETKNLKQKDKKTDENKTSTQLKNTLSKNSSQKAEVKQSQETYYAKCFIRFGNNFYDMSRMPEININADTENGKKNFRINMCKDVSTSCDKTGLGIQENDCITITGAQRKEKTWITDGNII